MSHVNVSSIFVLCAGRDLNLNLKVKCSWEAVLEIQTILRSMSAVRFFTEKCRLADVYLLKLHFNVEYLWQFSKLFFLFQLFSGTLYPTFANRNFSISA